MNSLFFFSGPPAGGAELILHERSQRLARAVIGPRIGIERPVLQKLEQAAMQLVGAGLQIHIDHTAGGAPILGVIAVGNDAHFADSLHRGADRICGLIQKIDGVDVVVDAVQQEVVLAVGTHAIGGKPAVIGIAGARLGRHHARRQARQVGEVALPA
jgi:hypothetical protein